MVEVVENSNLLEVKNGILCHQVNCIGVMGAGIALQIKKKWPKVYISYLDDCNLFKTDPKKLLGHVQDVMVDNDLFIANCFGQITPGNGCMTDYKAWDIILDKLKDLSNFLNLDLHFPWMIGCGLAGGDWEIMHKKFEKAFVGTKVYVHKLN